MPYQTLLHESTRIASGIKIENSVIIIDEAHNLVEAMNNMYSCQVNIAACLQDVVCTSKIVVYLALDGCTSRFYLF